MPRTRLKPVAEQVIVITGATSGIGLATARHAADAGAAVFLIARNGDALRTLADELRAAHRRVAFAVADVADPAAVAAASDDAIRVFGGYDSWVNNAGVFIYGAFADVPLADQRRVHDVIYWGVVHGTVVARAHLRERGGAIVNVGSVLGELAIPFQGPYCAAKFAVKGFTEAFRREVDAAHEPVAIALIKPAAANTTFMEHARNNLGTIGTRNPPPSYHPDLVARAILHACAAGTRDITVGGFGGVLPVIANRVAPRLVDRVSARIGRRVQSSGDPGVGSRRDNLYAPRDDLSVTSALGPFTRTTSLALEFQLRPGMAQALLLAGAVLASSVGSLTRSAAARSGSPTRSGRRQGR